MGKRRNAIIKMLAKIGKKTPKTSRPEKERLMDGLGGWPMVTGARARDSRTARRLGVGEEEEKEKIASNRTEEENERDLAP